MNEIEALHKTREVVDGLLEQYERLLKDCWIVNQFEYVKYLNEDEFETLQGLIRKVQLLKDAENKKEPP